MALTSARPVLILSLAASAVIISACGSSGPAGNGEAKKTGAEVAKDAAAALGATTAVHFSGSATDSSSKQPISLNLQLQSDGTSGTVTIAGTSVNVVAVGGKSYIKAPASFYVTEGSTATVAAKLADKWVTAPSGSSFDSFNLAAISKSLGDPTTTTINKAVKTGSLDGQSVVIVTQADGSQLFVAATGKPYPLKIVNSAKSKDGVGAASLTDYGKHIEIKAPAGAQDPTQIAAS